MHCHYRIALFRLFLAACSALIATQAYAQAGDVATKELCQRAEIIAVGKVASLESHWEANKSAIVTYVTLNVGEYLKGNAGQSLVLAAPGGEVDGVGEYYSHAARFARNEDVVVFAERDARGRYRVAGGQRGKLTVTKDADTGVNIVAERQRLEDFKSMISTAIKPQVEQ